MAGVGSDGHDGLFSMRPDVLGIGAGALLLLSKRARIPIGPECWGVSVLLSTRRQVPRSFRWLRIEPCGAGVPSDVGMDLGFWGVGVVSGLGGWE